MSQYATLDALIIQRLEEGPLAFTFTFLLARAVREECERISIATSRHAFRILDGRLQALRKAGRLIYSGGRWHVAAGGGAK